jgi:hypothetical protein
MTMESNIPNAASPVKVTERNRIPMNSPQPRLTVPEIPGFEQYWFLGKNVPKAQRAGYVFVTPEETELSEVGIASDREGADLGTRVSTPAGAEMFDVTGQPERLYLMKIPKEFADADKLARDKQSEELLANLRVGAAGADGNQDMSNRYVGKQNHNIFKPPKRIG